MKVDDRFEMALDNFKTACFLILPTLQAQEFELITPHLFVKSYNKGELILHENKVCDKIFFLNKGFVRMYYVDNNGNEINYRFTDSGHFFVDFQSFLTKQPSRFNWEAMQKAEVINISYQAVQEIYKTSNA